MEKTHPEAITAVLGGEERTLRLGAAALRLAEIKHGVVVTNAELAQMSFATMAKLTWIALLPSLPDLAEETVLGWLAESPDEGTVLRQTTEAIKRFAESITPETGEGAAKNGHRPARRPSSTSAG